MFSHAATDANRMKSYLPYENRTAAPYDTEARLHMRPKHHEWRHFALVVLWAGPRPWVGIWHEHAPPPAGCGAGAGPRPARGDGRRGAGDRAGPRRPRAHARCARVRQRRCLRCTPAPATAAPPCQRVDRSAASMPTARHGRTISR